QKITINGLAINFKTYGHSFAPAATKGYGEATKATEGEAILVLHGWGIGSGSWVGVAEGLARDGFLVVCPDMPGFGESAEPKNPWRVDDYVKFVEDFVTQLGLEKFYLLGHSFGGGMAAVYAAKHLDKVEKLVLCDSAIIRKERLDWRQEYAKKMAQGGKFLLGLPFMGGILPLARKIIYRFAGVHDYQKTSPIMKKTFQNVVREDLSAFAAQIKTPTLIVWGDSDKSTPLEDAYELNKIIPGAKLEIIENCGHNPHRTHTKELTGIITQYFKEN
ncbi:MAG: alpha/beta hydrolase, partial [Candidatus Paceibacterota bacterium]